MQLNLFNNSEKPETQIFGLQLLTHYIPEEIEYNLITEIDSHLWLNDLSRRVQHYGYKYDYKAKAVSDLIRLEIIPNWLDIISTKLKLENHFKEEPNQIIINEHNGDQLGPHQEEDRREHAWEGQQSSSKLSANAHWGKH